MHHHRPTCYECLRPEEVCVCSALRPVANRTRVTIVQHPRERHHPLNTARLVEGSLERVRVLRGNLNALSEQLEAGVVSRDAWLLFPGPDAVDLSELSTVAPPQEIVVLDGTWHQASTLLRDLPMLHSLRTARFTPPLPSEYLIRKEPKEDYLSTIESIAHVLEMLEPETAGLSSLRRVFRLMVQKNLDARRAGTEPRRSHRQRRRYRFPELLTTPEAPPAIVYAEGAHLLGHARERRPLAVAILYPQSNASHRVWIQPQGPVRERLLRELHLDERQFAERAVPAEIASETIRRLLAGRPIAAWNASTFGILGDLDIETSRRLFLKGVYCDWRRSLRERPERWGGMSDVLAHHGISWRAENGRVERRLAQTAALYRFLRSTAERAAAEG